MGTHGNTVPVKNCPSVLLRVMKLQSRLLLIKCLKSLKRGYVGCLCRFVPILIAFPRILLRRL